MSDVNLLDMHDRIEVRFDTHDNTIWHKAKIIGFRERQVQVLYDDGREEFLDKGTGKYRRPV